MKNVFAVLLFSVILLQGCSPKIKTNLLNNSLTPIEAQADIVVIEQEDEVPNSSEFVGDIKIGDTGFSTDCGYTKVIDDAKLTARQSGANLIHLTEVKKPNFGSTCYRIKAKLYRNLDTKVIAEFARKKELKNRSRLPADADYAVVYFYRPKSFTGSLIGYKVRMNTDTVIGRVRNGEKFEYKITDFGKYEFWAKTESKTSVILDVEPGQEYFIRCGINLGVAVGKPEMYVVENGLGISEYEALEVKK
ncbi:MAG: hypothetical protein HKN40_11295 [Winogradskyella sp.]|uniref:DUF2846 domain-containing protein n=1 Tax=Winogradskyella sp. TaxID=1883156 RepID=UPI0018344EFE|nr:hypothetical protein [Winogradskyella sp.]